MEQSPRLSLSYIAPSQAQKHVTANESFRRLDALVHLTIRSRSLSDQPASPSEGDGYLLPPTPTGAVWSQMLPHNLVFYQDNAWVSVAPVTGMRAWIIDEAALLVYDGVGWVDVGGGELGDPTMLGINATPDAINRLSAKSDAVLSSHDDVTPGTGDSRVKVNKSASGKTASHLFQTNFSGRAEFGLIGDDNFTIKVSADGSSWNDAIVIDKDDGNVGIGTNSPEFPLHIVGAQIRLEDALPILTLKDSVDSGVAQRGYVSFRDSGNVQTAYMGLASPSNDSLYIWNGMSTGGVFIGAGGGTAVTVDGSSRNVKIHNRLSVYGDFENLNRLVVNGQHIFDGGNDYGITIRAFEPGLCMVDASTGSGQSLIRTLPDGGIELWHDAGNNDGTIGHNANTTDQRSATFGETQTSIYTGSTERLRVGSGGGVHHPSASGGDKGNNTLNFGAVYDDNSLLSCYVFDQALDEAIIEEKWDEKVPNTIESARVVHGETVPEVEHVRFHEPMRKFKARIGTEYDPLTLDGYAKHWKEKRHLTAMPNEAAFDPIKDAHSTGEWVQRLIETVEIQAVLIERLNENVKKLSVRV